MRARECPLPIFNNSCEREISLLLSRSSLDVAELATLSCSLAPPNDVAELATLTRSSLDVGGHPTTFVAINFVDFLGGHPMTFEARSLKPDEA